MKRHLTHAVTTLSVIALVGLLAAPVQAAEGEKPARPKQQQFTGFIESVNTGAGTITVKHSTRKDTVQTFKLAADCKFATADKKDATIADFKAGDKILVRYEQDGDTAVAKRINTAPPPAEKKPRKEKQETDNDMGGGMDDGDE
jgi:Cu/Ag efflux protein CusF